VNVVSTAAVGTNLVPVGNSEAPSRWGFVGMVGLQLVEAQKEPRCNCFSHSLEEPRKVGIATAVSVTTIWVARGANLPEITARLSIGIRASCSAYSA
jgi:hypothetical protein